MSRFFLPFLLAVFLFAENLDNNVTDTSKLTGEFVLRNDNVVLGKAVAKIEEMSRELKQETGIGVYLSAIDKLENNETIAVYAKRIAGDLAPPFVLVAIGRIDRQIDLVVSEELSGRIDIDEALDDYIIPLFVEIRKDITLQQQLSAGLLNGIAFIVDTLAEQDGIVLKSSIGSGSKNFYDGLMWVVRIMLALTVLGFALVWYRNRKGGQ
ncbi:MAG: TPM domain-containing protein [Helicobacteraceae bacterium]|jgi:hypothetical protein|nr:TPM domain-containing protein [Helicobacteraceae bacterium]